MRTQSVWRSGRPWNAKVPNRGVIYHIPVHAKPTRCNSLQQSCLEIKGGVVGGRILGRPDGPPMGTEGVSTAPSAGAN